MRVFRGRPRLSCGRRFASKGPRLLHPTPLLKPYTLHPTSYTLHPTPLLTPYTLHPTSYTLHPTPLLTPYTLHPTPYTLHPTPLLTPYTLHPIPHTLHPTPDTRHPTPFTLPWTRSFWPKSTPTENCQLEKGRCQRRYSPRPGGERPGTGTP